MRRLLLIPGLLFGLLFAGGGYLILAETSLPMWQNWQRMQDWRPAYARLSSFSVADNHTDARYQYDFAGSSYQGARVGVSEVKDNIGSYHRDMQHYLSGIKLRGEVLPIWVNPSKPQDSVIDRNMRWGLFALATGFCSVFILIGSLVVVVSIRGAFRTPTRRQSQLRKTYDQATQAGRTDLNFLEYCRQTEATASPSAPSDQTAPANWRSRKGWETAQIKSGAGKGVWTFWLLAGFWNAVSSPVLFILPDELHKENYAALFALLFPIVGLFLIGKAIILTLEYRRFGKVLLTMDPYPGAIGGHVGGHVQVDNLDYRRASEASKLSVTLECVYSYVSGSGKNRSRRENIKWAEKGRPKIDNALDGVSLVFRFSVPEQLPAAAVDSSGAYHFWRLRVSADIPGVNLNRSYNIPVFATAATSHHSHHDISAQVATLRQQDSAATKVAIGSGEFDIDGLSRAVRVHQQGDRIDLRFPMFRNKALTLFCALFAGGFGFACYSMADMINDGGLFGVFMFIFAIPFFLVALVASIATIYLPLNNLQVGIRPGEAKVLRRLLFIPVYRRHLRRGDVAHLGIKRSGSTGQGVHKIEHFKIQAVDKQGRKVTLAEDIDGEDVATHFRDYLAQRLGVAVE